MDEGSKARDAIFRAMFGTDKPVVEAKADSFADFKIGALAATPLQTHAPLSRFESLLVQSREVPPLASISRGVNGPKIEVQMTHLAHERIERVPNGSCYDVVTVPIPPPYSNRVTMLELTKDAPTDTLRAKLGCGYWEIVCEWDARARYKPEEVCEHVQRWFDGYR